MYEYYYAFVEFIGGQYQDGLMVSCPFEETNEMEFVEIRVDDNFETSKYFVRLQADLEMYFPQNIKSILPIGKANIL